jgi:hypothetical protein
MFFNEPGFDPCFFSLNRIVKHYRLSSFFGVRVNRDSPVKGLDFPFRAVLPPIPENGFCDNNCRYWGNYECPDQGDFEHCYVKVRREGLQVIIEEHGILPIDGPLGAIRKNVRLQRHQTETDSKSTPHVRVHAIADRLEIIIKQEHPNAKFLLTAVCSEMVEDVLNILRLLTHVDASELRTVGTVAMAISSLAPEEGVRLIYRAHAELADDIGIPRRVDLETLLEKTPDEWDITSDDCEVSTPDGSSDV